MTNHTDRTLLELIVNGKVVSEHVHGGRRLLDFLRDDLHLTGTKEGCGEGECGSCTVLLDGTSVLACLTPMEKANRREVITIEGIGTRADLHPLQKALVEEGAVQCGFCTPGIVISGVALLSRNPSPTHEEIVNGIAGNLCRCTGYQKIVRAIEHVAEMSLNPERSSHA